MTLKCCCVVVSGDNAHRRRRRQQQLRAKSISHLIDGCFVQYLIVRRSLALCALLIVQCLYWHFVR